MGARAKRSHAGPAARDEGILFAARAARVPGSGRKQGQLAQITGQLVGFVYRI